jgi:hypothetical protein
MAIKWIEHHGQQILYIDYRDCKSEQEMILLLEEQAKWAKGSPKAVLILSNVTNTTITSEFMNRSKQYGKEIFITKTKKSAVVGIIGMKSILMQGYQMFTGAKNARPFQNESEALDWLIQEDG